jgi:5,6-dimethylbenzimidazole synthase
LHAIDREIALCISAAIRNPSRRTPANAIQIRTVDPGCFCVNPARASNGPTFMQTAFDETFRVGLRDLLRWRRDVRRFSSEPLAQGTLERLIELATLAPSVGLSQPWRFVIVEDRARRRSILHDFQKCNAAALQSYSGELFSRYARLKLAGLREAPCQLAVFADPAPSAGHALGRRTMPQTVEYSVVAAIHTLWLAARAEGIGMGWISILDPSAVNRLLDVPESWRLVGYFCLGYPQAQDDLPELQRAGWEHRRDARDFIWRR